MHTTLGRPATLMAVLLLAAPSTARAFDWSLKVEPGVAVPLSAPQTTRYGVGGAQSVKLLFGLAPVLDIGPSASFLSLAPATGLQASGGAWTLGGGLRLKRPHDAQSFAGLSPWLDLDALYVRTGALNRFGFDAALGVSVPLGVARTFWVGPFVRYFETVQGDRVGYDNRDARILTVGVSFEAGSGLAVAVAPEVLPGPVEIRTVTTQVVSCPDRDHDSVPDSIDRCPEVAGPIENGGCPNYKRLVIKRDKLELKEKLYFAWDQAKLEEASLPTLDEVVQALKDNPGFRVQVDGHTDSSGNDDHNQTLSEERAQAVLDYLASHGIARERLTSKGFSSSRPNDTNATVAGRENNRRVEFVVSFIILDDGAAK